MKMTKFIAALLAMGLSVSAFLVSCGAEDETAENAENAGAAQNDAVVQEQKAEIPTLGIKDVMNLEWTEEKDSYISTTKDLYYVGEYTDDYGSSYTFFATSEEIENENNELDTTAKDGEIIRVYNMNTDNEIKSFTNSSVYTVDVLTETQHAVITEYAIDFISDEYFAVLKISFEGDPTKLSSSVKESDFFDIPLFSFEDVSYTLTIYDATGATVKEIGNAELVRRCSNNAENFDVVYAGKNYNYSNYDENSIIYEFIDLKDLASSSNVDDYFYVGTKLYKDNGEDAEPTFVKDYGMSRRPSLTNIIAKGEYYFERYGSSSVGYVYTVYDANFNKVYDYSIPSYANKTATALLFFTNGNMLLQYSIELPEDATEYDFEEDATKYDLVTLSISKDAVVELTDVNYYIFDAEYGDTEVEDQRIYANSIEALAFISYIGADKKFDTNYANMDMVALSADGKIAAKIDLGGKARTFPTRFDENRFAVALADGTYVLYDETGAKVANLSTNLSGFKVMGDYIYSSSENAIYAINGALIRDFDKDFATVSSFGRTLMISHNSDDATVYSIFANGKLETIDVIPFTDMPEGETMPLVSKTFGKDSSGYYYIVNTNVNKETGEVSKTYSYYNEEKSSLATSEFAFTELFETEDFIMMQYVSEVEEEKSEINSLGETVVTTEIVKTTHYVKFLKTK